MHFSWSTRRFTFHQAPRGPFFNLGGRVDHTLSRPPSIFFGWWIMGKSKWGERSGILPVRIPVRIIEEIRQEEVDPAYLPEFKTI